MNKSKKETIVYTAGTWDLFHIGHLNILKESKELGDKLIVGVSTDKLVASYKEESPVRSYEDRAEVIKNCVCVDKVVKQEKLLDIQQMLDLDIDILTIGSDWKEKDLEGLEWAKKQSNIKVVYLPYTEGVSSTQLKNKIRLSDLKNKAVLITGASSGIGASIAELFAKHQANIGIHYSVNEKGALELAKKIKHLTKVKVYKQDFSSDPLNLVHNFVKDFGRIDILVNNAGIVSPVSFFDMSIEDYDEIFKVNSRAPFILTRDAFNYMKKNRFGRIINISSFAVKYGKGRNDSIQYAATKATLDILTKGLSNIGAKYNILVNSIRPGVIMTRLQKDRPDLKKRIDLIPIKRMGKTKDIANLVVYLASDKGSFITGEIFTVSGGE